MDARRLRWLGVALIVLPGCMIDQREFDSLREQVLLQQRVINDHKARQEELSLRVDNLNNGFKILGDKATENSQRIDDLAEVIAETGGAPPPPVAAAGAPPSLAAAPAPAAPSPVKTPAQPPAPILLTNRSAAAAPPPAPSEGEDVIGADTRPDKLYVHALQAFNRRDYAGAADQFRSFLATFPEHILAGNAQYWIGECFYTQKRFADAATEFDKVERLYPKHRKVPDALLKKGLSLRELRRSAEAQGALGRILAEYPQSEAAAKAREFLARWK